MTDRAPPPRPAAAPGEMRIKMFECEVCGIHPRDGATVRRVNEKGMPGIYRCEEHYDRGLTTVVGDPEMNDDDARPAAAAADDARFEESMRRVELFVSQKAPLSVLAPVDLAVIREHVRELSEARRRAEAALADLAEWAIDAGGWRLFAYADPPPDGVFDLSDPINPEVAEALRGAGREDDHG